MTQPTVSFIKEPAPLKVKRKMVVRYNFSEGSDDDHEDHQPNVPKHDTH